MIQADYRFVPATTADLPRLMPVLREFYAEEHLPWNEPALHAALTRLVADPGAGRLRLILRGDEIAGHLAVGFCFSLEFGGRYGLLDELFVRPIHRGAGLGKRPGRGRSAVPRGRPAGAAAGGQRRQCARTRHL